VAPDYFHTLDLPLIRGPGFQDGGGSGGEKVVIINDEIARACFPGEDPVGRQIKLNGSWHRIVGVAASIHLPALAQSRLRRFQVFFPFPQNVGAGYTIIARTGVDRAALIERIKEAVWALDRSIPITGVSLVEDALAQSLSQERSNAFLMLLFALTALTLGAVGIYGVVAYSVSRRFREMGIRLALGASASGLVGRVVVGGMGTVLAGILVGAVGSFALGSTLAGFLVEVDPRDPAIFLLVALVTTVVALLATWLPARRAAGASPSDILRAE
jgi:putative ABC transport system permease protein